MNKSQEMTTMDLLNLAGRFEQLAMNRALAVFHDIQWEDVPLAEAAHAFTVAAALRERAFQRSFKA